jgi:hypothetical protein
VRISTRSIYRLCSLPPFLPPSLIPSLSLLSSLTLCRRVAVQHAWQGSSPFSTPASVITSLLPMLCRAVQYAWQWLLPLRHTRLCHHLTPPYVVSCSTICLAMAPPSSSHPPLSSPHSSLCCVVQYNMLGNGSGCTAVVCVVTPSDIIAASAGDSR